MPWKTDPNRPGFATYVPSFMERVKGAVVTYSKWVADGCPRRHPDEVKEIFEQHCKPCEHYEPFDWSDTGRKGRCALCRCHVSPNPEDLFNKITIPQASCPIDKWANVVEPPPPDECCNGECIDEKDTKN